MHRVKRNLAETRKVRSAEIQVDTVVNWARPAKFILRVLIVSICAD